MAKKPKKSSGGNSNTIALNKKARHDYFIEDTFEAGISLQGWEVKSLRAGKCQLTDSYVFIRNGEAFLVACLISPLLSASTHIQADGMRMRKLLLHRRELNKLIGAVDRKGYTIVPISMYWKNNLVKLQIGLGKGKAQHDKRAAEKDRDWQREKARILRAR